MSSLNGISSNNMTLEDRKALSRRVAQVLSEILSDRYDADIKITLKEPTDDVPSMSTDTTSSTVSTCCAEDCS